MTGTTTTWRRFGRRTTARARRQPRKQTRGRIGRRRASRRPRRRPKGAGSDEGPPTRPRAHAGRETQRTTARAGRPPHRTDGRTIWLPRDDAPIPRPPERHEGRRRATSGPPLDEETPKIASGTHDAEDDREDPGEDAAATRGRRAKPNAARNITRTDEGPPKDLREAGDHETTRPTTQGARQATDEPRTRDGRAEPTTSTRAALGTHEGHVRRREARGTYPPPRRGHNHRTPMAAETGGKRVGERPPEDASTAKSDEAPQDDAPEGASASQRAGGT